MFDEFAESIAGPSGMRDFDRTQQRYATQPWSEHRTYAFHISARDLARFGQLYLNGGQWRGRSILPREWVAASTRAHTETGRGPAYGYLWWVAAAGQLFAGTAVPGGSFAAYGFGSQFLLVLPGLDRVASLRFSPTRHAPRRAAGPPIVRTSPSSCIMPPAARRRSPRCGPPGRSANGGAAFRPLIERLLACSPEVRAWWPQHDVAALSSGTKRLHHPVPGDLLLQHVVLQVADDPEQKPVPFTASGADRARIASTWRPANSLAASRKPGSAPASRPTRAGPSLGRALVPDDESPLRYPYGSLRSMPKSLRGKSAYESLLNCTRAIRRGACDAT